MESLYYQPDPSDKTQWLMQQVVSVNYAEFLCKDDPTRIGVNIGTNMHKYITNVSSLYNLCQTAYKKDVELPVGNFNLHQSGKIRYRDNVYILAYYECPIRVQSGTIFNCPIPSKVNFTTNYAISANMLPVLIPLTQPYYLLHRPFSHTCNENSNALLCPGSFRFTVINANNGKYLTAIYNAFDEKSIMYMLQDNNFYLPELKYNKDPAADEVVAYLINLHTRRTQRGYYAPIESAESYSFRQYGSNFNTIPTDKSYYEKMESTVTLDETTLPFAGYPTQTFIKIYVRKCLLSEGKILKPLFANIIPARDAQYDTPILVDIKCIDLNFIWQEEKRKRDEIMPKDGYYALSGDDTTYLKYYSHSPGVVVVLTGYIKENQITLENE